MSLLHSDPEAQVRSLAELAGLALALSTESQHRYARLAQDAQARGQRRTAAVFARLAEEEAAASESLQAWCREAGAEPERRPAAMPPDIFRRWDELAESALVSPYRALAAAVASRDRAFAYYSYLAARADEPSVRQAAERLASEELRHAARLRSERRQAWRREQRQRPSAPPASSTKALMSQAAPLLAEAADVHAGLAAALAAEGDARGAQVLEDLARIEAKEAGIELAPAAAAPAAERRRRAFAPLERLFELFEQAASHAPDEAVLAAAQTGLAVTVERMERLSAVALQADR